MALALDIPREDVDVADKEKKGKVVATGEAWMAVRVPVDAKAEIEEVAREEDRSVSSTLRRLVLEALDARRARGGQQ